MICTVKGEDRECGLALGPHKDRTTHQMRKHGLRNVERFSIVTNQCPVCYSTFRSMDAARQHLQAAVAWGR
jgi:hypothetical protein